MITRTLKAGQLKMTFEDGFLRYICQGSHEIVRMIYFAFRDRDWNTLSLSIDDFSFRQDGESFNISYKALSHERGVNFFRWRVAITGSNQNKIDFSISGECVLECERNRIGFCLLHPISETINRQVIITHPDGTRTKGTFPEYIEPHAPFVNIASLKWQLPSGIWATAVFKGEIFEMEDQRNWTDSSFKTFCTPLHLKRPVVIKVGTVINQQILLSIGRTFIAPENGNNKATKIWWDTSMARPILLIGAMASEKQYLPNETIIARLKELPLTFLRVEVDFSLDAWENIFLKRVQEAQLLGWPVELCISFTDNPIEQSHHLKEILTPYQTTLQRITFYSALHRCTPKELIELIVPVLRKKWPGVPLGAGSNIHFVEVNRYRLNDRLLDYLSFAINPQVHAFDNRTLIENLATQGDAVMTAKQFFKKRLCISPVTLRPRYNPDAVEGRVGDSSAWDADPRQLTDFGAGWALGCLKYLNETGAHSVTLFETFGEKGYLNEDNVFPAFDLLKKIGDFRPKKCIPSFSSQPLIISSFLLARDEKKLLILANHAGQYGKVFLQDRMITINPFSIQFITIDD